MARRLVLAAVLLVGCAATSSCLYQCTTNSDCLQCGDGHSICKGSLPTSRLCTDDPPDPPTEPHPLTAAVPWPQVLVHPLLYCLPPLLGVVGHHLCLYHHLCLRCWPQVCCMLFHTLYYHRSSTALSVSVFIQSASLSHAVVFSLTVSLRLETLKRDAVVLDHPHCLSLALRP